MKPSIQSLAKHVQHSDGRVSILHDFAVKPNLTRGTCDGKSIIHPRNLWVRGSNLTGGHNRLSCPRSADTALKPYLTLPNLTNLSVTVMMLLARKFTTLTSPYESS